ncbi:MAG TPA: GyrI-like domain-containing protein [Anaerolineaceae bacterium]|jgi:hypothetical protein
MQTLDLKKELKYLYAASAKKVDLVDVPAFNFIRIDGAIEANATPGTSPGFQQAMQALYGASYTLKFTLKKRPVDPVDYPVMALEGLWWVEDGHFEISQPGNWKYTVMILQPDLITADLFEQAIQQLCRKKPNPAISRLRLERFHEGLSIQTMHIGPYASEPETVSRMHAFAEANGYRQRGGHHEIYLGDPLRTDPARLKTILRLPVEKVGG